MKMGMLIAAAVLTIGISQSHATTITVTSTNDSGPGTLRSALASAADGDTIDASVVSGTILLTNGELLVTNSVTIVGPGPNLLAIDGRRGGRIFHIGLSNTVSVSSMTITNGLGRDLLGGESWPASARGQASGRRRALPASTALRWAVSPSNWGKPVSGSTTA
jgi:hypothetical protein